MRSILFTVLVFFTPWCWADEVYVRLKDQVAVDHLNLLVKDVLTITANDPSISEKLLFQPLMTLKGLSNSITLNREDIERVLSQQLPNTHIVWGGGNSVQVAGKTREVNLSPWVDSLADQLLKHLNDRNQVQLIWVNQSQAFLNVPPGEVKTQADFLHTRWMGNDVYVPLSIFVDNRFYSRVPMHFKVQRVVDTPMDLNYVENNGEDKKGGRDSDLAEGGVSPDVAIQKDNHIQMVADDGPIRIESEGIALGDAKLGDTVRVKKIHSEDVLTARVIGPNQVAIGSK